MKSKFDFRPGDKVILMSVKDIKQMVNCWTADWRNSLFPSIMPGDMERMCDGQTSREVQELSDSGALYIDIFYFPPAIATLVTPRISTLKIRLIRG